MQLSKPEVLEEVYTVTSADTDFTTKLNASSLVNMFIQSAWHHAEALGFGLEFLHENGVVWMLSRLHMKLNETPLWNQELVVKTWPKGIHRVFYQRDFEAVDQKSNTIAAGTSEWMIIDLKAKRPRLYHADHHIFNPETIKHAIDTPVPVLNSPETNGELFSRKVNYSDIDLNEHLTTIRYIDWMFDTFEIDFLRNHLCSEVILNFVREVPFGTKVNLSRHSSDETNNYLFEFTDPENKVVCFRGKLGF